MSISGGLQEIVQRLNAEPFSMQLSIVQFDEKTPMELMETLNEILKYLDKKSNDVRIRDESPEALFQRIGDFLHVLGSHFACLHESTVVS